jgi:di/tricarboxylate transporter
VVLAVHRNGINITSRIAELPLEIGDTLLVITARNNLEALESTRDFVMTDTPDEPSPDEARHHRPLHVVLAWSALCGVVLTATLTDYFHRMNPAVPAIPIHYAAMVGALVLLWLKVMTPREAYASIDWQVLLMLYGLLGLGMAMQNTGTAVWLARGLVEVTEHFVASRIPAAGSVVAGFPADAVAHRSAVQQRHRGDDDTHRGDPCGELGVNSRPFIMGVTVASSAPSPCRWAIRRT